MDRCQGTTKSGERCKRPPGEGSSYCAAHADQADAADPVGTGEACRELDPVNLLLGVVVLGVAVASAILFRRWFKLP